MVAGYLHVVNKTQFKMTEQCPGASSIHLLYEIKPLFKHGANVPGMMIQS